MEANARMTDRIFTITFAISLGAHLLLVVGQLLSLNWFNLPRFRAPIDVVYEEETAREELRSLQEHLQRATRQVASATSTLQAGVSTQIRIPERPILAGDPALSTTLPERAAIVDLTNLVEASRGDPVLLSYFGAIREQIQHTANEGAWLTGASTEGMVLVSFVLTSNGAIGAASIVPDRSAPSQALREIAVQIVKAAAPFPPFPPSMTEPSKTIFVPLEFLLGKGN